ncbi:hypothetical protein BJ170DRAFT_104764 [Xylariales sp. AK1849]|nr:hypothetical protein BJ170DRAFT_104764 [Xylariales sp. AK1849]
MLAMECALYYCVKVRGFSVEESKIRENATELTNAAHDPKSWQPSYNVTNSNATENMLPQNEMLSLEFNSRHSVIEKNPLELYSQSLFINRAQGVIATVAIRELLVDIAAGDIGGMFDGQPSPLAVGYV